jgi:hypothetical protein
LQIADQIKTDLGAAMKAGEKERVGALRLLLSELQKDAKEGKGDERAVLRRERKRRREAEHAYRDNGRAEQAAHEAFEAHLIEQYLPPEMTDEQLAVLVEQAIEETGAKEPRDMGRAIAHVRMVAGDEAEGSRISAAVKAALTR